MIHRGQNKLPKQVRNSYSSSGLVFIVGDIMVVVAFIVGEIIFNSLWVEVAKKCKQGKWNGIMLLLVAINSLLCGTLIFYLLWFRLDQWF